MWKKEKGIKQWRNCIWKHTIWIGLEGKQKPLFSWKHAHAAASTINYA